MIATVVDPLQEPSPADDADTAAWKDVHGVNASGTSLLKVLFLEPWFTELSMLMARHWVQSVCQASLMF